MSQEDPAPEKAPTQEPQPQPLAYEKYLQTVLNIGSAIKSFDFKKCFQDVITFLSIVAAYFIISLTYQLKEPFQKLVSIKFKKQETIVHLFYLFAIYLLSWNVVAHFLKKRAERPPPKKQEFYQETPEETPAPPVEQLPTGVIHYHNIIYETLDKSTWYFLLFAAVVAYSFFSQPEDKNLPKLVDVERISYLGVWFLSANLFYILGSLLEKITKLSQFKVLGIAMGFIIAFLSLGLANGLNTFIFI